MFKFAKFAVPAIALAAALSMTAGAPAANAADTVKAGVLTCKVGGGTGFVFGSSKKLRCVFDGVPGKSDRYVGVIQKFGVDLGVTQGGVLAWVVFAPSNKLGRGALAGEYAGASAEATVVVGAGANALIGGSNRTVSLQPLSLQGQTGVNVAAAVASIQLRPVR
jgi:hypothetical protein